jgi:hypothetical protein
MIKVSGKKYHKNDGSFDFTPAMKTITSSAVSIKIINKAKNPFNFVDFFSEIVCILNLSKYCYQNDIIIISNSQEKYYRRILKTIDKNISFTQFPSIISVKFREKPDYEKIIYSNSVSGFDFGIYRRQNY